MQVPNAKFLPFLILALSTILFFSCENNPPADHEGAMPHNNMGEASELSEEDMANLANADGKAAQAISPDELAGILKKDTALLTVINFWQHANPQCLVLQQHLQTIQQQKGKNKVNIIALNLDPQSDFEKVNLAVRKAGMTSSIYQISSRPDLNALNLTPSWDGQYPAIALVAQGELKGFYQQDFSENELLAILNPYFVED